MNARAKTSDQPSSLHFRDDEEVYASAPGRLPGVADEVFGRTDAWPADCLHRPANRARANWKCVFPADPQWNLTIRELAFAMLNPTHRALREAGLFVQIQRWSPTTVISVCRQLALLARWARREGLPADLSRWRQEDWQAFIDARALTAQPSSVRIYVDMVMYLVDLAPVLSAVTGHLEDPWPGLTSSQVADFTKAQGLTTPAIDPATWWPLLRAAWAYVDRIGPQTLERREQEAQMPPVTGAPRSNVDTMLEEWLAENAVPLSDRSRAGQSAPSPPWTVISLAVTGSNACIFSANGSGKQVAAARRAKVQAAIEQGRTVTVAPGTASQFLGVNKASSRAARGRARDGLQQALDDRVRAWLADPANLIPVHPVPFKKQPAGEPVWNVLDTYVLGHQRVDPAFGPNKTTDTLRRRELVRAVADDPARRILYVRGSELRMIRAACYIFIAALSAMRDSEVQEIRRGALTEHYGAPAVVSTQIKNEPGRPRKHWWIIEPVAQAIALIERLSWHETHVFSTLTPREHDDADTGKGFVPAIDIEHFIDTVNQNHPALGLEPIPEGPVRPHMFRKTMSIITRMEPDGEIANGLQLKHAARRSLANAVTAAYGQVDKQWAKEFNHELETAAAERLVHMLAARRGGQAVALGPGAARLHAGLDKVNTRLEARALRANTADHRLEVSLLRDEFADLHLGTINHCLWNRSTAECQNALPAAQRGNAPLLGACEPARCRNSVLTIGHAPIWQLEEKDLTERLKSKLPAVRRQLVEARLAEVRTVTTRLNELTQEGTA
ncbi:hypothetical protein [Streptacidiphilus sp. P02-A3a]|uniref:hypothetical protein n=1 Tax=Streptacidiphilus sp. P02-A3a TaxID=2704468 RepID=UPI0015FAE865|nr:hypothetical protein [Streptacidiphilus sp. P02-A3a]QMU69145.1 hypothetical protein GXP74_13695 [Streptacidiphilus sp. P02-A3a]